MELPIIDRLREEVVECSEALLMRNPNPGGDRPSGTEGSPYVLDARQAASLRGAHVGDGGSCCGGSVDWAMWVI